MEKGWEGCWGDGGLGAGEDGEVGAGGWGKSTRIYSNSVNSWSVTYHICTQHLLNVVPHALTHANTTSQQGPVHMGRSGFAIVNFQAWHLYNQQGQGELMAECRHSISNYLKSVALILINHTCQMGVVLERKASRYATIQSREARNQVQQRSRHWHDRA